VSTDGPTASTGADGRSWDEVPTYHGQAVLKEPVWTWEIPNYFFVGGMAGASAGLAYLSELRGDEQLARRAWGTALAAIAVSPALLTSDLGRPERFLNMLRMFKVTSPMSVGSWILASSGATTALAAANSWRGVFPRTARLAKPAAAALGLPLSTYTAALLADTAVPAWHEARRLLPCVFASGAALSAGAVSVALSPLEQARPARRLALGAAALEIGFKEVMERSLGGHGEVYRRRPASTYGHLARACIAGGATLLYVRGGDSRIAAVASGALLCAGALSARWSVFKAGLGSAADPKFVAGAQRAGIERGQRKGAARRTARVAAGNAELGSPATARR
jgi:formate-dependent nitrite reductase membrane component NrfD